MLTKGNSLVVMSCDLIPLEESVVALWAGAGTCLHKNKWNIECICVLCV